MKLVRGISLFIVCIGLFIGGAYLGFSCHAYFYPGKSLPNTSSAGNRQTKQQSSLQISHASDDKMQVSLQPEHVITADTSFVVIEVDLADHSEKEEEIPVPTYYMGMNREDFETQIKIQNESPSLAELTRGFQGSEIRSFSKEKVELCKFYQKEEEEENDFFYLAISANRVVVYKSDGRTVYMDTDIQAQDLPADVLQDLLQRRVVDTEEELYDFLESYSS